MTPFRVPWTGGTQIGAMWIEQQRTESCRGYGAGKGGQPAAERGGGVAGAELSANQTGVGAVSRRGRESPAARQLRARLESILLGNISPSGARSSAHSLRRFRTHAGGGTLGGRSRTRSGGRDPAALDESGGLWRGQRRRKAYRQRRERQPHFGELVQLDASFHPWLEDRAAHGCLMHMVDDATGTVLCQFSAGETTWAAAHLLRAWIERYGVPRALYTDWKNVYVRLPNVQERLRGEAAVTQFGQMCAKLGIRIIAASSPQAKGRVERVHGTHQDRLVKKLRLATVSNYDDANAYLQEHYIAQHNRHYARRGAAPSPATPSPKPTAAAGRPHRSPAGNHPWRQGWQNMKTPAFSPAW